MSRAYERLSIEDFGKHLLDTGDLDPIYIALHKMQLPHYQLCRWLVAYWCLYHAGAACWLSEQHDPDDYWHWLFQAAKNSSGDAPVQGGRWPRGAERRHWRGAQATASASLLTKWATAGQLVEHLSQSLALDAVGDRMSFAAIRERVLALKGFGPWIAFKVGDMLDRLGVVPVSFEESEVFMFDTPRQAALMLVRQKLCLPENAKLKDEAWAISEAVSYLTNHFNGYLAPPLEDRVIGLQEVETILCKWKSHMGGHYPLGKDTREIAEGLEPWVSVSPTAGRMRNQFQLLGNNPAEGR